jgi:hypothetical protein
MRRSDRGKGGDRQHDGDSDTSSATTDHQSAVPGVFGPRTDDAFARLGVGGRPTSRAERYG